MSRTRDRASTAGLLPRMEARPLKGGGFSYRYHPLGGKTMALGRDKAAALRQVLDLTGQADGRGTLRWVMTEYRKSPRWLKLAEGTRADYETAWRQIDPVLGAMPAGAITSNIVARYVHVERADAPRRADIEKSLLSRIFGHGIKIGACAINPTIGVEPHGGEARTEAPQGAVLARFLAWVEQQTAQRRIVGMAAEYASLAGSRRVEFLNLTWPQVDEVAGEVRTFRAKQRGKKRERVVELVAITPRLAALLERLKTVRAERGKECLYVFPTRDSNAYTARGFATLWQRCVLDAIKAGAVAADARFTFHDLRAYYATVHKAERGALPDLHKNPETTARVYDRNTTVRREAL